MTRLAKRSASTSAGAAEQHNVIETVTCQRSGTWSDFASCPARTAARPPAQDQPPAESPCDPPATTARCRPSRSSRRSRWSTVSYPRAASSDGNDDLPARHTSNQHTLHRPSVQPTGLSAWPTRLEFGCSSVSGTLAVFGACSGRFGEGTRTSTANSLLIAGRHGPADDSHHALASEAVLSTTNGKGRRWASAHRRPSRIRCQK